MKIAKIVRDPFVWLIALVVLTPAGFIALGITQQPNDQTTVTSASQTDINSTDSKATSPQQPSEAATNQNNQPITQAEQATLPTAQAVTQTPAKPVGPVCDQSKKQAAEAARNSQLASEDNYHQAELDKLRFISVIYRKYWDDEVARHDAAVAKIQADFQAAIGATHC